MCRYYPITFLLSESVLWSKSLRECCMSLPLYKGNIISPNHDVSLLCNDTGALLPVKGKLLSRQHALEYVTQWESL